jgi:hypothetical protein
MNQSIPPPLMAVSARCQRRTGGDVRVLQNSRRAPGPLATAPQPEAQTQPPRYGRAKPARPSAGSYPPIWGRERSPRSLLALVALPPMCRTQMPSPLDVHLKARAPPRQQWPPRCPASASQRWLAALSWPPDEWPARPEWGRCRGTNLTEPDPDERASRGCSLFNLLRTEGRHLR